MPSSRSTPAAHGAGGFDIELVKGVGVLRLEGARSHHAGHGPVRSQADVWLAGCYPYASGGEAGGTSSPLLLAGRITRSGACWFTAHHHQGGPDTNPA